MDNNLKYQFSNLERDGIFDDYTGPDNPHFVSPNETEVMRENYKRSFNSTCKAISENMMYFLNVNATAKISDPVHNLYLQIRIKDEDDIENGKKFKELMSEILVKYLDDLIEDPNVYDILPHIQILSALRIIKFTYSYDMYTLNESPIRLKRVSEDLFNHTNTTAALQLGCFQEYPIVITADSYAYYVRKTFTSKNTTKLWFVKTRY